MGKGLHLLIGATDILTTKGLSKRYGAVAALGDVSFALAGGEIRALCGENGAGKSTFVKLLMGIEMPDSGSIEIAGKAQRIGGPQEAQRLGLGLVAQELSLAPQLSILDNIWLGSAETPLFHRGARWRSRAREALALLGAGDWPLDRRVAGLSIGERQIVEIARLLARDARILILDEPTATLSDAEIARLLAVLKALKRQGRSVIYISHRLGEVFELCDSVSVFRNGEHVATRPVAGTSRGDVIELMLGRPFGEMYPAASAAAAAGALVVERFSVPGAVQELSLTAPRGKILCLVGQLGSGAGRVTRALAGLEPEAQGRVFLDGKPVPIGSVPRALARNIVFLSEDRAEEGIFAQMSVGDNLVATRLSEVSRAGIVQRRKFSALGARLAERVGVAAPRLDASAGQLSGGNQQKLLFGRLLERPEAGVLLMNEPTRGIDVGARAEIYRLMRALCGLGYALIMVSSDLEEVVGMADIAVTLYRGRTVGRYERGDIDMAAILADITHPTAA